ncbi:hypothetical protein TDB9533_01250 [Thalassocella blandensis]|nr:hypothetical protein TDB9533_01250 [Thalassocella blandensis]
MTPQQFYKSKTRSEIEQLACAAKTTLSNFRQIALAGGSVSPKLAERLAEASGFEMTELEILYPDRFVASTVSKLVSPTESHSSSY